MKWISRRLTRTALIKQPNENLESTSPLIIHHWNQSRAVSCVSALFTMERMNEDRMKLIVKEEWPEWPRWCSHLSSWSACTEPSYGGSRCWRQPKDRSGCPCKRRWYLPSTRKRNSDVMFHSYGIIVSIFLSFFYEWLPSSLFPLLYSSPLPIFFISSFLPSSFCLWEFFWDSRGIL